MSHFIPVISSACIGLYCGRTILANGSFSECGACQSGYRANESGICKECDHDLSFYDWNYLIFMAIVPLGLNMFFIDVTIKRKQLSIQLTLWSPPRLYSLLFWYVSKIKLAPPFGWFQLLRVITQRWKHLLLHASAVAESLLSFLTTLLIFQPRGSLNIRSCESTRLSDWYTLLYNPSPDFIHTIHCTQEAVHPLYSMVLVLYAFGVVFMLLCRLTAIRLFSLVHGSRSLYIALYFYPVLAFSHAIVAGLIYYSFPYIVLVVSIITNALHFSTFESKLPGSLTVELFSRPRNLIVLLFHWLLHSFGILSLLDVGYLKLSLSLMGLVPLPAALYILTAPFTDPKDVFEMTSLPERRRNSFSFS